MADQLTAKYLDSITILGQPSWLPRMLRFLHSLVMKGIQGNAVAVISNWCGDCDPIWSSPSDKSQITTPNIVENIENQLGSNRFLAVIAV
ncbi:MAG: hypothetical protein E6K85_10570 [Thaumarchaeota archaeon]|nr:MAG: hypothetical protein AUF73_02140 [Thaumarchaeota archaeon 13_1_20CM_2_39_11]TLY06516.1 MAG: hypothetical protein E6K85_10570 [Nitrososphaerota archaeon]